MSYTPIFAVFYLLLVFALGAIVSIRRITLQISLGDGENKVMRNSIRAHANAMEHVIPYLILLYFFELKGGSATLMLVMGIGFGVARLSHAFGMLKPAFIFRRIGASLTVAFEFALVALAAWKILL